MDYVRFTKRSVTYDFNKQVLANKEPLLSCPDMHFLNPARSRRGKSLFGVENVNKQKYGGAINFCEVLKIASFAIFCITPSTILPIKVGITAKMGTKMTVSPLIMVRF